MKGCAPHQLINCTECSKNEQLRAQQAKIDSLQAELMSSRADEQTKADDNLRLLSQVQGLEAALSQANAELVGLRKIAEAARVLTVCLEERIDASEAIKTGDLHLAYTVLREVLYG